MSAYTALPCRAVALLLFLNLLSLLPPIAANELSYQAHSYNDLRQWPTLVLKGAQWLKIDMNYAPANFCTANTTATQRVQHGDDGCFLLNHDDLALNRTAPYNTSDDVLALVDKWAERDWLHGAVNVSIALCFKYDYGSVCDNSTESGQWRALMQSFYDRAQSLISNNGLALLFVLDGAGSIDPRSPCLTSLYPRLALYVHPIRQLARRVQLVRHSHTGPLQPAQHIPAHVQVRGQAALRQVRALAVPVAGVGAQRPAHHTQHQPHVPADRRAAPTRPAVCYQHRPRYDSATHTLPRQYCCTEAEVCSLAVLCAAVVLGCAVQWEVYASSERGSDGGWNEKRAELMGQTAGGVQVVVEYEDIYYLVILSSNGSSAQLTVYEFDEMLGDLRLNYTTPLPPAVSSPLSSFHALQSHALQSFAAITSHQSLSLYLTPTLASWHQLTAHRSFTLSGKGSDDIRLGSVAHSALVWETAAASVLVAGQVSISDDGGRVYVNVFGVQLSDVADAVTLVASTVIPLSHLPSFSTAPRPPTVTVTAVAIALTMDDVQQTCPPDAQYDMTGVLSFTTANYDAYMAVVCVSLKGALYVSPVRAVRRRLVAIVVDRHLSAIRPTAIRRSRAADTERLVLLQQRAGQQNRVQRTVRPHAHTARRRAHLHLRATDGHRTVRQPGRRRQRHTAVGHMHSAAAARRV